MFCETVDKIIATKGIPTTIKTLKLKHEKRDRLKCVKVVSQVYVVKPNDNKILKMPIYVIEKHSVVTNWVRRIGNTKCISLSLRELRRKIKEHKKKN